jgi:eukaryotic-like serine/threonine-protein kinase
MALSIPQMARMSQLLEEALALGEAGRRVWLERATQEHPDLADALREALLPGAARAAQLQELMSLPKFAAAAEASAPAPSGLAPGARVGPYQLIRLLGAGGMAEVWLARRADGAFKREVALKLPMLNRLEAGLEMRFARERDILASLEHPHIARLYDAGVDPQGLPYLSMEYVQGAPLTDWCDARRLGIPQRLGLFLQVLEAVQYAHEKSVIHRDLKPSNILVTESEQVRLLDFGVARLLEAEETGEPALTSVYGRALTPDYASPELLRGDPIDTRSDLYSLGVLLYELLTGTRPYRLPARVRPNSWRGSCVGIWMPWYSRHWRRNPRSAIQVPPPSRRICNATWMASPSGPDRHASFTACASSYCAIERCSQSALQPSPRFLPWWLMGDTARALPR